MEDLCVEGREYLGAHCKEIKWMGMDWIDLAD